MARFFPPSMERLRALATPERGIRWGEVLLVVALGITLADLTWNLIPGPASQGSPTVNDAGPTSAAGSPGGGGDGQSSLTVTGAVKNLFGDAPEKSRKTAAPDEPVRETELNLTLKGILAHRNRGKKLALIASGDKTEKVYAVGDSLPGGAEIVRIESRRIILRRNGVTEALNLEVKQLEARDTGLADQSRAANSGGGIRQVAKHRREVDRQMVQKQLQNLPSLLQQAKAVPATRNGQQVGFKMVTIQSGSLFEDLGLKEGDVIQQVNGRSIRTPADALNAYQALKGSQEFQVQLLRKDQSVTLNYAVQ
mgnify:CR=1 FL=1